MASGQGHVKTFSASLGSGFVDVDGMAYRFDAGALPDDTETVRSGDLVEVQLSGDTVLELKLLDDQRYVGTSEYDESETDDDIASQVTLKASGKTPARFDFDTFKKRATRLDFE